jgi:tRNA (guanine6-N2)-methyltransferase
MVHVVTGIPPVARRELAAHLPGARVVRTVTGIDERTDLLLLGGTFDARGLLKLRTIEDAFVVAAEEDIIPSMRAGLAAIRRSIARSPALTRSVHLAFQFRRRKGKPTFRVIARKSGEHAFRRVDLQRATELGILDRFPDWRLVEDDAQLEVWVQLINSWLIAGMRLSDNSLRQRTYRQVSLPAALKPTIAAAMVLLSSPSPDDVFLDPMCGSGTILIERALAGRYHLLLGGDADPEAVEATRANVGPRYKPVEIHRWDAAALPLETNSVSVIVSNLPFGKQIGTRSENRALYPRLIAEWTRVLDPSGRMVLLTSERNLLRSTLEKGSAFRVDERVPLRVRGLPAEIAVIRRSQG